MKQLALTMMVVATLPMMAADALVGEYAANRNELATGLMLHPNQSFEYTSAMAQPTTRPRAPGVVTRTLWS
jgi:hypothetical protein